MYVLNDSYREALKLFILTRKVGARMKFCEVINDFAEHMTRLEQNNCLKRTDRAYQLSPNSI